MDKPNHQHPRMYKKVIRFINGRFPNGFTLLETLVVIVVIGILATITIASYSSIQATSRDAVRSSRINVISEALEKYYQQYGEYPTSCSTLTSTASALSAFKNLDPNVLTTPSDSAGTNSFVCTTPTSDKYAYIGGGTSYTLQYKADGSGSVVSVTSRKQTASGFYTLALVANPVSGGTLAGGGLYGVSTTPTITATPGALYSFSSWTGDTGCSGAVSHTISMSTNKSCTSNFTPIPISAPAAPTVVATDGSTTTWNWNAASCGSNTARYQYDYTISSGYDSGWVATGITSVSFTTTTDGYTYTVAVQAQCYNAATTSAWSGSGSDNYTAPYTLTVASSGNGTVSGAGSYSPGSTPTITATPNSNYLFSSWTGDTGCSGVASHTITMNADKSCTANFTPNTFTLTVASSGNGTVSGGGTYNSGTTPTITATPNANYQFSSWTGDTGCSGTASHTITMSANKSCTANFTIIVYTLTLASGGNGTVSGAGSYNSGTSPTMTATPNANYQFSSWTGDTGCSGTASHTITMSANKSCTANFTLITYTLAVASGGNGTVSGAGTYNTGSTPTITATPNANYVFSSWTGDTGCSGVASHTITMDANKSCTANFVLITYTLTLASGGNGTVSGAGTYNTGSTPTMTATPNANYQFSSWTGDTGCSGVASHTITMSANKSCTANFTIITFTLTLNAGANGTVSGAGTYNSGSSQTMTATPATYYQFSSWTGDTGCSGVASHSITMNANKTCTSSYSVAPIGTPAAPTVAVAGGSTSTWTWNATSCGVNTARYQVDFTTSVGYDSGWSAYGSTSWPSSTPTNFVIYTLNVQTQCYNALTTSSWSATGTKAYQPTRGGLLTALSTPTIATGTNPWGIAISPDGKNAYVSNVNSATLSIYTRSTSTGILSSQTTITTVGNPYGVIVSPDGAQVYAVDGHNNTVRRYTRNTSTGALTFAATIATSGTDGRGIVMSADGTSVYSVNYTTATVSQFSRNTSTGVLTALSPATITTGASSTPFYITISPDGTAAYVGDYSTNYIAMFSRNTSTGVLTATSPATASFPCSLPIGVDVSADGKYLYAAGNCGEVGQWSINTSTELLTSLSPSYVNAGNYPYGITVSADNGDVYVTDSDSPSGLISQYSRNVTTGKLTALSPATVAAGNQPFSIVMSPDDNYVYVADSTGATVYMFSRS